MSNLSYECGPLKFVGHKKVSDKERERAERLMKKYFPEAYDN